MTNSQDDRRGRARTETDNDITRGCRGYNAGIRDYKRERDYDNEKLGGKRV